MKFVNWIYYLITIALPTALFNYAYPLSRGAGYNMAGVVYLVPPLLSFLVIHFHPYILYYFMYYLFFGFLSVFILHLAAPLMGLGLGLAVKKFKGGST